MDSEEKIGEQELSCDIGEVCLWLHNWPKHICIWGKRITKLTGSNTTEVVLWHITRREDGMKKNEYGRRQEEN